MDNFTPAYALDFDKIEEACDGGTKEYSHTYTE